MELKKLLIVLTVTISIIIGLMFGVSYGWYAYSNAETKANATTIKTAPTIIFAQAEYINSNNTMPIADEDRYNYANKNVFSITIGEELKDYEVGIEISLKDIKIADELKIPNYKYEFLEDGKVIKTGNFDIIGDVSTISLMPMTNMTPVTYPTVHTYEFYIWLSDDGTNQNYLMNKNFSARININSATKHK